MFGTSTTPTHKPQLAEDPISSHDNNSDSPNCDQQPEQPHKSKPLYFKDISQRKKFFKTAATKCRDILNQLKT
jgi:hypothetical protein